MSHDMKGKVDKEKEVTDYERSLCVCVRVCCVGKAIGTHKQ